MFEAVTTGLVDLSDSGLHERIGELELTRRRTETELAPAIALAEARQLHQADAHRSMKGFLKATCNWSNHEVSRWRSAAAAVNAHPSIGDAWIQGRIGSPQVTKLAATHGNRRVRDAFPAFLPFLLVNAKEMCFEDFSATVDYFVAQADAEGAHDERDDAIEHRRASVKPVGEAVDVHVFGGDGVTTDEIIGIYETFCDAELDNDIASRRDLFGDDAPDHDLARTAAQRAFDAMIAIFRAAAAAGVEGKPADTVVNVIIDSTTFGRITASAGLAPTSVDGLPVDPFTGLAASNTLLEDLMADPAELDTIKCETHRVVPVHPHDVPRAVLAGHVRRVVLDSDGHVVDFGRKKRLFEGPAREAAKLLIRRCQHPGCDLPAGWSDVDHNIEWGDDGETNQNNAGVLCSNHNAAKHRMKLHRKRATNPPDTPDDIRELEHLARERLQAWCANEAA